MPISRARNPRGNDQRRAGTALDLTRNADRLPESQCPSSSKIGLLKDDTLAFPWGPNVTPITIPVGILATESQGCNFRGHSLAAVPPSRGTPSRTFPTGAGPAPPELSTKDPQGSQTIQPATDGWKAAPAPS